MRECLYGSLYAKVRHLWAKNTVKPRCLPHPWSLHCSRSILAAVAASGLGGPLSLEFRSSRPTDFWQPSREFVDLSLLVGPNYPARGRPAFCLLK